ncbi:rcc01693 family protein [Aliirhizobium smilacinae]|uniref:rcc01693 family protein n=1 Tax=Aliirhizobium smilacinae TaxID=1395944 RepID=UPI0015D629C8|nr:rcc01693 family protein [Rhizobium smilacinae]
MNAATGRDADDGRAGATAPFPWDVVMHVGFCLLRLPPKDFWAMTPAEFFLMAGGARPRGAATGRAELDELMRAFPDR